MYVPHILLVIAYME